MSLREVRRPPVSHGFWPEPNLDQPFDSTRVRAGRSPNVPISHRRSRREADRASAIRRDYRWLRRVGVRSPSSDARRREHRDARRSPSSSAVVEVEKRHEHMSTVNPASGSLLSSAVVRTRRVRRRRADHCGLSGEEMESSRAARRVPEATRSVQSSHDHDAFSSDRCRSPGAGKNSWHRRHWRNGGGIGCMNGVGSDIVLSSLAGLDSR